MSENIETKVAKALSARGLLLEREGKVYRVVDAATGTFIAADWSTDDGFGLTLAEVEAAFSS